MYLKSLQKLRCLGFNFKTGHLALRREENIVEFLEGRFRNQTLSLVHKKKTQVEICRLLIHENKDKKCTKETVAIK